MGEEYLTVGEVAQRLRISPRTVKTLITTEGLPAYSIGRRVLRVPAGKFERWLESRRVEPQEAKKEA